VRAGIAFDLRRLVFMTRLATTLLFMLALASTALAQSDASAVTRAGAVLAETAASHNMFDSRHAHLALGGAVRIHAARRLSFGVEFQRQVGGAPSPHLFPTLTASVDLREARPDAPGLFRVAGARRRRRAADMALPAAVRDNQRSRRVASTHALRSRRWGSGAVTDPAATRSGRR
jgi:hypothetical protein